MIAVHAYAIGETAMLSSVLVENFSRSRSIEKHNAFVKILFDGFNTYNCTKYQPQIY